MELNTDTIISIATVALNAISIICYMIIFLKKNKTQATTTLTNILENIPNYYNQAKNCGLTTKLQITNFILAMIKTDCEEAHVKFNETKIKKQIEETVK